MLSHFLNSKNKYKTITVIIERRKSEKLSLMNISKKYLILLALKVYFFMKEKKI